MFSHVKMAMGHSHDLPYSVELWDDTDSHVQELIALTVTGLRVLRLMKRSSAGLVGSLRCGRHTRFAREIYKRLPHMLPWKPQTNSKFWLSPWEIWLPGPDLNQRPSG